MLILTPDHEHAIRAHAAQDYPSECCGALLGGIDGGHKRVAVTVPLKNTHEDGPARRFRLSPDNLLQLDKLARRLGHDILGFYHSHPDAPARPSEYDRAHAWPVYSYVIVRAHAAGTDEMRSWVLLDDAGDYEPEAIDIDVCILEASALRSMIGDDPPIRNSPIPSRCSRVVIEDDHAKE